MAKQTNLDTYEKSIEAKIDRYIPVSGEKRRRIEAALAITRKTRSINIRISESDLSGLKRTAQEEGVPYQTLISSVLHKYLSGRLVDEKDVRRSVELLYRPKVVVGER